VSAAFRTIAEGRALTPSEYQLLVALAGAVGRDLSDQVGRCIVVGECNCGCSSIQLSTSAAALPENETRRLSAAGRSDYLCVSSTAKSAAGHEIFVGLHVVAGRLHELEIFDADAGEGIPVDLLPLTAMTAAPEVG
jgi:hypothetical protein